MGISLKFILTRDTLACMRFICLLISDKIRHVQGGGAGDYMPVNLKYTCVSVCVCVCVYYPNVLILSFLWNWGPKVVGLLDWETNVLKFLIDVPLFFVKTAMSICIPTSNARQHSLYDVPPTVGVTDLFRPASQVDAKWRLIITFIFLFLMSRECEYLSIR